LKPASPASPPLSRRKLWLFRGIAAIGLPICVLVLVELTLRLLGFGYPTSFLLKHHKAGQDYWMQNNQFGWRFFGRRMARAPHAIWLRRSKPAETCRIFVFGESAAFGDPQPPFGMVRMLQAMLEARHPGTKFEVVNAAMTGINSHVILPIARDCVSAAGDVWVIYMGNNEVVGPFGAGTVFGMQTPPRPLIRAILAAKTTRIGQMLESLLENKKDASEWGGMTMFIKRQVEMNDPRMQTVYRNFEANLRDIIHEGQGHGVGIVVSTVPVNLGHCAPFASAHRQGLSAAESDQWTNFWKQGLESFAAGSNQAALESFRAATHFDDRYADLRFAIGEVEKALKNSGQAQKDFNAARDLDTLRFRCDSKLTEIVRRLAENRENERVLLADPVRDLGDADDNAEGGSEFFYDHVHLTFEGNYRIALSMVPQIEKLLPERARASVSDAAPWPSSAECGQRLGWSDLARRSAMLEMLPRLNDPPFINQLNHATSLARFNRLIEQTDAATQPASVKSEFEKCQVTLSAHPSDPELCIQAGRLAEMAGQTNVALTAARQAVQLQPSNIEALGRLGAVLERQMSWEEAASVYREVVKVDPEGYYALNNLGRVLSRSGLTEEAISTYKKALKIKPRFGPAWLSLGELYASVGRTEEANKCYQQALAHPYRSVVELTRMASFCRDNGWFLAAATNMAEVLKLNPTDRAAYVRAGQDFAAAGLHPQAKSFYAQAVDLAPEWAAAHFLYGRELGLEGSAGAAEQQFREASRLMPDLPEARINLAITLAKQGRKAEAVAEYESVLQRWPTNEMARKNLVRLQSSESTDKQ
jgi:tetratricopeptide (TPR) repeat protein